MMMQARTLGGHKSVFRADVWSLVVVNLFGCACRCLVEWRAMIGSLIPCCLWNGPNSTACRGRLADSEARACMARSSWHFAGTLRRSAWSVGWLLRALVAGGRVGDSPRHYPNGSYSLGLVAYNGWITVTRQPTPHHHSGNDSLCLVRGPGVDKVGGWQEHAPHTGTALDLARPKWIV